MAHHAEFKFEIARLLKRGGKYMFHAIRQFTFEYITDTFPNPHCSSAVVEQKIDQAMEILKNNLVYQLREEVEVLKERIESLLERIKQLELENDFLKSNAPPDILLGLNNEVRKYRAQQFSSIADDGLGEMQSEDLEVAAIIGQAELREKRGN